MKNTGCGEGGGRSVRLRSVRLFTRKKNPYTVELRMRPVLNWLVIVLGRLFE